MQLPAGAICRGEMLHKGLMVRVLRAAKQIQAIMGRVSACMPASCVYTLVRDSSATGRDTKNEWYIESRPCRTCVVPT